MKKLFLALSLLSSLVYAGGFISYKGSTGGISSINSDTTSAQTIAAGTGISVATAAGTTTVTNTGGGLSGTTGRFSLFASSSTIGNSNWAKGSNGEFQWQGFGSALYGTAAAPLLDFSPGIGVGAYTDVNSDLYLTAGGALRAKFDTSSGNTAFFQGGSTSSYVALSKNGANSVSFRMFGGSSNTDNAYYFWSKDTAPSSVQLHLGDAVTDYWELIQAPPNSSSQKNNGYMENNRGVFLGWTVDGVGVGNKTDRFNAFTITRAADKTNVGGTTAANAATTIVGSGTQFTMDFSPGDRVSLSSAASTYATVTSVTDNTNMVVSTALGNGSTQTINKKQAGIRVQSNSGVTEISSDDQGNFNVQNLTASKPVFTDSSKNLTSSGTLAADQGGTGLTSPGTSGNVLTSNGSAWVSSAPSGGFTFTTISSNVTLACGSYNFVSTAAARSLTLPAPSSGCIIKLKDKTGTASTNNITVLRAGSEKIENVAASFVYTTDFGALELVSDGTDWWAF